MDPDPLPSHSPFISLLILLSSALEFHSPANWVGWSFIVLVGILCIFCSAFVSGSEIAYFGMSHGELEELEEKNGKKPAKALEMLSNSERLLATILILNNLVNITMVVVLSYAFQQVITVHYAMLDFLLQTVLMTFLLLVFGEIFPKLIARSNPLRWVLMASSPLHVLYKLLKPVAGVMEKSSVIVNKVITKKKDQLSTEELEEALKITDLSDGEDKDMLEGILSFGEKEASEVMISRVDVTAIEFHDTWDEVMKVIMDTGYSRIPVYDTSEDTIRGVLYSKDLLPYIGNSDSRFRWQTLLREPYFVPESRKIDDLLEDFRKKKIHIAIVIDEYGGTKGIVTLEDIIEEIVGEIDDEYDETTKFYKKLPDGSYLFDGKTPIWDFCEVIGIEPESLGDIGEAETIAGLILEIKGDFPTTMETFTRGEITMRPVAIERHRIIKVKVNLAQNDPEK